MEVFQHALDSTSGEDLHRVLWLKSRNSEVWLDRRTNYTRSCAVMSMVRGAASGGPVPSAQKADVGGRRAAAAVICTAVSQSL